MLDFRYALDGVYAFPWFSLFPLLLCRGKHAAIERALPLFPVKDSCALTLPFGEDPLSRTFVSRKVNLCAAGHDLPPRLRRRSGLVDVLSPCARLRRRT